LDEGRDGLAVVASLEMRRGIASMLDRALKWLAAKWAKVLSPLAGRSPRLESSVGGRGEELAANYLRGQGIKILHRGYRSPLGEIDIIAVDPSADRGRVLVFVEVKTWSLPAQGGPADAVDDRKQERLTRLALEFLKRHHLLESPARFDVIQVILEPLSIRHFPNAFEATGKFQWFS